MSFHPLGFTALLISLTTPLAAQQSVSRAQAVAAALASEPRLSLARADTLEARAYLPPGQAFPNPTLLRSYTQDYPQKHLSLELPIDLPWIRAPRIGAAHAARQAAGYRFEFEQANVKFDAE